MTISKFVCDSVTCLQSHNSAVMGSQGQEKPSCTRECSCLSRPIYRLIFPMVRLSPLAYRHSKCLVSCTYVLSDLSKEARFLIHLQKPSILAQVCSHWLLFLGLAVTFVTMCGQLQWQRQLMFMECLIGIRRCLNNPHAKPLSPQLCSTGGLYISCFSDEEAERRCPRFLKLRTSRACF